MADEGFTIGSHTRSHPKLVQVTPEQMEAEIVESSRIIQNITGTEIVPFAFPNTATGIDRKLLAGIREHNPFLGLFFDAKGFQEDVSFIVNRIWAEKPIFSDKGVKTNLPYILKDAYQEFAYEKILGLARNSSLE
jgi:peptidoglycan/xylan/chitin deacetylase (PgdA/CDA1 family)